MKEHLRAHFYIEPRACKDSLRESDGFLALHALHTAPTSVGARVQTLTCASVAELAEKLRAFA